MELLKAISMPFQINSLLVVLTSSLLLAIVSSLGVIGLLLAIVAVWLMLVALTQYSFKLIEDAANGHHEARVFSPEMLDAWNDARCWVHPVLAVTIAIALALHPEVPRLPVLLAAAFLFPASIAAIAMSGHAIDALNPVAMARVMRGLGQYYLLTVLWMALCMGAGVWLARTPTWPMLQIAIQELLVLLVYAFIGGAIFVRRVEMGFEPLVSPERKEQKIEDERIADRQRMIDAVFDELRSRRPEIALAKAQQWLEKATPQQLSGDVRALLSAGAGWYEQRAFAAMLRALAPLLISMRQPALAFAAVEAGIAAAPGFSLEQEGDAVRMIHYAVQTGRKRLAATLLANYMATTTNRAAPSAELISLHEQLGHPQQT